MARVGGRKAGALTFTLDALKGAIPAALGTFYFRDLPEAAGAAAALAVAGHCYSVFLRGHGGKGVATAAGALLVLAPIPAAIGLAVWITTFWLLRITSASAFVALAIIACAAALMRQNAFQLFCIGLICLIVIRKHATNLQALLAGEERRF